MLEQVLIGLAIVFGPLTGWLAIRRKREPAVWFAFGVLLGPIATLLVLIAPPGRCPACDEPVRGWPSSCVACGMTLSGGLAVVGEAPAAPVQTGATDEPAEPVPVLLTRASPSGMIPPGPAEAAPPQPAPAQPRPRSPRKPAPGRGRPQAQTGELAETVILATGTFVGGSAAAGMGIGFRYAIGRRDEELHILGPLDQTPGAVALTRSLAALDVTLAADQLLVTGSRSGGPTLIIAFRQLAVQPGLDLERALSPTTPGSVATARPTGTRT